MKYPLTFCLLSLLGCLGCERTTKVETTETADTAAAAAPYREELLSYALDNLNRLEEFASAEILQQLLRRLDRNNPANAAAADEPFDSLLASWPEPEMLRLVINRLNQWIQTQQPPPDWKCDPMTAMLPKPLLDLPQVKNLGEMKFSRFDGYALQEAAWLRDVSDWAKGDRLDDLERAKNLFDWTVRNIQLDPNDRRVAPQFPWETLLFGRGSANERAWVFLLLLRQINIDAAILAIEQSNTEKKPQESADYEESLRLWCVGVLIDGKIFLFDPLLGLPIPAPNGVTVTEGRLAIQPATLDQVFADAALLQSLDADESHRYRVKHSDLKRVTALLEASPPYLQKAMKVLESRLAGAKKMVLTASPSTQAKRWRAAAHIADAKLWLTPYKTLDFRSHLDRQATQFQLAAMLPFYALPKAPLYRGRVLQLKGKFIGEEGATQYFQAARPSNEELAASSTAATEKLVLLVGKQYASYWSGLVAYQRGNYSAAVDYFRKRTLEAFPGSMWTTGALYNLARSYEAGGETERAILQYGSNADSPGYLGDLLRAKWLQQGSEKGGKRE